MASSMTVSEARAALPQVIDRVRDGHEITLTRYGEAVAVVVHPDTLRMRRAQGALDCSSQVGELLEAGRQEPLGEDTGLTEERAEELISEIRTDRAHR